MTPLALWCVWTGYRYYFFGKIQAQWQLFHGEDEMKRRAQENKRFYYLIFKKKIRNFLLIL